MDDTLWQSVLGEIELNVSRASFATWFKNTILLSTESGDIVVGVPNIFAKQQLEVKYKDLIKQGLKNNSVKVKAVEFKIHNIAVSKKKEPTQTANSLSTLEATTKSPTPAKTNKLGLNTKYNFENFIVGSSNELALNRLLNSTVLDTCGYSMIKTTY